MVLQMWNPLLSVWEGEGVTWMSGVTGNSAAAGGIISLDILQVSGAWLHIFQGNNAAARNFAAPSNNRKRRDLHASLVFCLSRLFSVVNLSTLLHLRSTATQYVIVDLFNRYPCTERLASTRGLCTKPFFLCPLPPTSTERRVKRHRACSSVVFARSNDISEEKDSIDSRETWIQITFTYLLISCHWFLTKLVESQVSATRTMGPRACHGTVQFLESEDHGGLSLEKRSFFEWDREKKIHGPPLIAISLSSRGRGETRRTKKEIPKAAPGTSVVGSPLKSNHEEERTSCFVSYSPEKKIYHHKDLMTDLARPGYLPCELRAPVQVPSSKGLEKQS